MTELEKQWPEIQKLSRRAFPKYIFATVNEDGSPHITPMGSLALRDDCTGFYFERYSKQMRGNLDRDNRISILLLDFRLVFWLLPLIRGRFAKPVAVRLNGTVGERREASLAEENTFKKDNWAINLARVLSLRGYRRLWAPLNRVRDIRFESFEPVDLGIMGRGNWGIEEYSE